MPPSPLFGRLTEVGALVAASPGLFLVSDFDGTLAPIVPVPEDASLPAASRRLLSEISALKDVTVAILSGRSLEDIRAKVGLDGLTYGGNHGLEISGPGLDFIEPRAAEFERTMGEIAASLTGALHRVSGVRVENKRWTLSVHLRGVEAAGVEEARRIVGRVVETVTPRLGRPVRLTEGRKVLEVRPRLDWDKGQAASFIGDRFAAPGALSISLGDDVSDEEMFRALKDGITVKVGSPEDTSAAFFVEGPSEVERFLGWLVESIRVGGG